MLLHTTVTEHAIGSCDTNRVHAIGVLAAPKEVRRKWRHVFLLCQERAGLGPAPVPRLCAVEAPLAQGERGEAEQYHGHTCERVRAQIRSLERATGGLAGCFEAAGGAAQGQAGRPGPWLWQGGQWGAAEGGRQLNPLEHHLLHLAVRIHLSQSQSHISRKTRQTD